MGVGKGGGCFGCSNTPEIKNKTIKKKKNCELNLMYI